MSQACLVLFAVCSACNALKLPNSTTYGFWRNTPAMQPFHECRATATSILMAWSLGRHSLNEIDHYDLRVRWPLSVEQNDHIVLSRVNATQWVKDWSPYYIAFSGPGRQWEFQTPDLLHAYEFSVRAVTTEAEVSDWSAPVVMHSQVNATQERFPIELRGTGRNNADFASIRVNGETVYNRTDLNGLALAIFDRSDFTLLFLAEYNVSVNESESLRMANDLRAMATPDKFVALVSGGFWEWKTSPVLTKTLERYGSYYFGQWAYVFSNQVLSSPYADLAETASQDTFGHPYAFFGSLGLGPGNGYESIQLNTGQYLSKGKSETAIIRLVIDYDYLLGRYFVFPGGESSFSHDFFTKAQLPQSGSLHNPVPNRIPAEIQTSLQSKYAPYIGNLWNVLDFIREANETVVLDEYNSSNSGFEIVQNMTFLAQPLVTRDPRPPDRFLTELERVWGGPSARYSMADGHPSIGSNQTVTIARVCPDLTACADYDDPSLTVDVPLMEFGVGMFPTQCHSGDTRCSFTPNTVPFFSVISAPHSANISITPYVWSLS